MRGRDSEETRKREDEKVRGQGDKISSNEIVNARKPRPIVLVPS